MAREKQVVRNGYDRIAEAYAERRKALSPRDGRYLQELFTRLPNGSRILDLGCGSGVPITRLLAERYVVTGLDLSPRQLELARARVPEATFICGDMTEAPFPGESFDAVCSILAVIHVPREEHAGLFHRIHQVLREGGYFLVVLGADDWTSGEADTFLGVPMFWSQFGPDASLELLHHSGFTILRSSIEEDEFAGVVERHLYVLAQKKGAGRRQSGPHA